MKRLIARAMIVAGLAAVAAAGTTTCLAAEAKIDREQVRKSLSDAQARLDAAAAEVAELSRQLYGGDEHDVVRSMLAGRRGAMLVAGAP